MTPAWWVTYLILALYAINAVWLAWLGKYTGTVYWVGAGVLTVCATKGLLN